MQLTEKSVLSYNTDYITVDGRPWFPVMGEIHYSRVKENRWERELLKMKAGGIEIVSFYCIWIHHEEVENEWDFTGQRNLRRFINTIQKCGLYCILRIGPWAHAEVRNGGFPDWLIQKEREEGIKLRSNDPKYLKETERFYRKIYEQAAGYFLKDGGPIIGIQIENEYGHCGGLTGYDGQKHMKILLSMAKRTGFDVPLYTATGWGGALTGDMLPVMGGYCEAPWDQRLTELEPNGNYVFTEERNDQNIGSDRSLGEGLTFDPKSYPYLMAELGGGLQVTKHRRPIVTAKDIAAMSMVKIGSGCNMLGYYMYHGGTNPKGKGINLQESKASGSFNDLPVCSYDFQAPIREYGQLTDTYREIRRLSMFIRDYQELLCQADYISQPGNSDNPKNLWKLRTAVRTNNSYSGFFFLNNYQRRYEMLSHKEVTPVAFGPNKESIAVFDKQNIKNQDFFFYPFGLKTKKATVETANAIPLCILNRESDEEVYVFYVRDGCDPAYRIKGALDEMRILTLTDEEALHAARARIEGKEYLFLSDGDIVPSVNGGLDLLLQVEKEQRPSFFVWPSLPECPEHFEQVKPSGEMGKMADSSVFAEYWGKEKLVNPVEVTAKQREKTEESLIMKIRTNGMAKLKEGYRATAEEVLLKVEYEGESAEMYLDGELAADHFYTGQIWEVGIRDLLKAEELQCEMKVIPLTEKQKEELYLQSWPKMTKERVCQVNAIYSSVMYRMDIVRENEAGSYLASEA